MIKFSTSDCKEASFKDAAIGDEFCVIENGRWSSGPESVIDYEVVKVGKRDIKCVSKSGIELIVKLENTWKNPCAYECGGEEAKSAIAAIQLRKRQKKCASIVDSKSYGNSFDDELMEAIEKFAERQKARGE